jgi:two-component system NarL family sensor kinase
MEDQITTIVWLIVFSSLFVVGLVAFIIRIFYVHQKKMYQNMLVEKQKEAKHRLELMQGMLDAQENEKRIISNTVHDSVGSIFMMMKGNTSQLKNKLEAKELKKKVDDINGLIELLDKEIRKSIYSLTPSLLQDYGFKVAIDEYIKLLKSNSEIRVEYQF